MCNRLTTASIKFEEWMEEVFFVLPRPIRFL
jgi:hypothetical protein